MVGLRGNGNRSPIVIAWNIADAFLIVGINVRREPIEPPPTIAARSAPLGIGWWGFRLHWGDNPKGGSVSIISTCHFLPIRQYPRLAGDRNKASGGSICCSKWKPPITKAASGAEAGRLTPRQQTGCCVKSMPVPAVCDGEPPIYWPPKPDSLHSKQEICVNHPWKPKANRLAGTNRPSATDAANPASYEQSWLPCDAA